MTNSANTTGSPGPYCGAANAACGPWHRPDCLRYLAENSHTTIEVDHA
ncbi:MAG: hypothetical protein KKA73_30305 [Chloroflexi bacterium]|nr:hypothetical protein [Chloroflexota bacterium]